MISPKEFTHDRIIFGQRIICTVLIALMILTGLIGGFFTVPFDDDFTVFYTSVDRDETDEFKDGKFVSFGFLSSVFAIPEIIRLSVSDYNEHEEVYYKFTEDDSPSLFLNSSAIAYLVSDSFESDFSVLMYYILLMAVSIFLPVFLICAIITILKKYLKPKFRKTHHEIYKGTLNLFRITIYTVSFLFLLGIIVNKTRFGFSAISAFFLCALGIISNAAAPYFKKYTYAQKKYRTVIQAISLLGVAIFACFAVSLSRSGLTEKAIALFDERSVDDLTLIFKGGSFAIDEILALLSGFVFFIAIFGVYRSLGNNICRLGFTTTKMKKNDYSRGDAYVASTIRPNVAILVFLLLIGSQSELIFHGEEMVFLILALASILLMTLTEITVIVLRETLCVDLGKGGMFTVLEGTTYEAQQEDNLVSEAKSHLDAQKALEAKKEAKKFEEKAKWEQ